MLIQMRRNSLFGAFLRVINWSDYYDGMQTKEELDSKKGRYLRLFLTDLTPHSHKSLDMF